MKRVHAADCKLGPLVGFPGAAVIEKGSRWEAVQRAGRLLKQGGPLPSCSCRAEGTTKYLATCLGCSRTQKHTEKDLPGAGVHPTALNTIPGANSKILHRLTPRR